VTFCDTSGLTAPESTATLSHFCRSETYGLGALEGIRTPNLLIRSQMLYPLSYER
jgi:hypothetical protein